MVWGLRYYCLGFGLRGLGFYEVHHGRQKARQGNAQEPAQDCGSEGRSTVHARRRGVARGAGGAEQRRQSLEGALGSHTRDGRHAGSSRRGVRSPIRALIGSRDGTGILGRGCTNGDLLSKLMCVVVVKLRVNARGLRVRVSRFRASLLSIVGSKRDAGRPFAGASMRACVSLLGVGDLCGLHHLLCCCRTRSLCKLWAGDIQETSFRFVCRLSRYFVLCLISI